MRFSIKRKRVESQDSIIAGLTPFLNWKGSTIVRRILKEDSSLLFCSDNSDQKKYPIDVCPIKKVKSIKSD